MKPIVRLVTLAALLILLMTVHFGFGVVVHSDIAPEAIQGHEWGRARMHH